MSLVGRIWTVVLALLAALAFALATSAASTTTTATDGAIVVEN